MNGVNLLDAFSVKPLCSGFWVFFSCSSSLSFIIDSNILENVLVRGRPFNLKGGVMVFCFVQKFLLRTTQELEYLFFLTRKAGNYFPEFNIRLYDKISESDYFFFLHQNQNILFSNIGNQNILLRKKT
jgi:hypothetical protein